MANRWIMKGYGIALILGFVGLSSSTYYAFMKRKRRHQDNEDEGGLHQARPKGRGRPVPTYSLTRTGTKVSDEQIKEWLSELVCGDGFPYGYRKLTFCLRQEHGLTINHMCKELDVLRHRRRVKRIYPRHLAKRDTVIGPDELWEMDRKYGYIHGTGQFFFQLSLIDVFDRMVIDYHIGLSCTAADSGRVIEESLRRRGLYKGMKLPKVRTDNGPQFISRQFGELCETLGIIHERIPIKTPNMNAHIESFHSILDDECYLRHEFESFMQAYEVVTDYMEYYNKRRRHGSLRYMAPEEFHRAFMSNTVAVEPFVA